MIEINKMEVRNRLRAIKCSLRVIFQHEENGT
jgi:hypothetical protein